MMVLGFCVSGSTAAVHTGDASSSHGFKSHLMHFFSFNNFLMHISESDKH